MECGNIIKITSTLVVIFSSVSASPIKSAIFNKEKCPDVSEISLSALRKDGTLSRCSGRCLAEGSCFGFGIKLDRSCQLFTASRDAVCGLDFLIVFSEVCSSMS